MSRATRGWRPGRHGRALCACRSGRASGTPGFLLPVPGEAVAASARDLSADGMAVLVRPMLASLLGGVMYGADPIEGRPDRVLVSVVRGGPDRLVDGGTPGERHQFTRRARPLGRPGPTSRRSSADEGPGPPGGGFGIGAAWHGQGARPHHAALVADSRDPPPGSRPPGLAGLVTDTGSVLSHPAVLAREYGVATAVGVTGATTRFSSGTPLAVDGGTGAVTVRELTRLARAGGRTTGAGDVEAP